MSKKLKSTEGFRNAAIGYARKTSEPLKQVASASKLYLVSMAIQKGRNFTLKIRTGIPDRFGGVHQRSVICLI